MSVKKIQEFCGAKQDGVIGNETLTKFMRKMGVTRVDTAHFFGNIDHESGGFTIIRENMNYTTPKRLMQVFGKYVTPFTVNLYVRQPELLGDLVYGGRMGNAKDEGYKFRGRGYLQLTGKDNYKKFSEFMNVDFIGNPDLVATDYALASAIYFFTSNKLWGLVSGVTDSDIIKMRKRINGGTNGISQVKDLTHKYYNLIK